MDWEVQRVLIYVGESIAFLKESFQLYTFKGLPE
jgi:hypothetical protein